MKFQIKHRYDGSVLFEAETGSLKACLELATKSNADLRFADFYNAKLCNANLGHAWLENANLENAKLVNARLVSARYLNKKFVQVAGIGSENRTTLYCIDDNKVWCGCFRGTLEELRAKVQNTHKNNPKYKAEYKAAIKFFETVKKAQQLSVSIND